MRVSNVLLKRIHAPVVDGWLTTWVGPTKMKLEKNYFPPTTTTFDIQYQQL